MTYLPETALAFARECMGWKDAYIRTNEERPFIDTTGMGWFYWDDTFAVIWAVRRWCADHEDTGFTVHFTRRGLWEVIVQRESTSPPEALSNDYPDGAVDLCDALMTACLEAARKLKGLAA